MRVPLQAAHTGNSQAYAQRWPLAWWGGRHCTSAIDILKSRLAARPNDAQLITACWVVDMGLMKVALIAMLALTEAQYLPLSVATEQPGDDYMTSERKRGEEKAKAPSPPREEFVITPAGPVRKENVHRVGPDEAVRRNEDGTYTIVPKTDSP
jgi:hypothetical protein